MIVHVDLSQVPPVVEVREAQDFTALSAVISVQGHVWVDPDVLCPAAEDASAARGFAAMVDFARAHGWVDDRGFIRAHVENGST